MIKNMKIKKSLILGFGVTIVVSVAIIRGGRAADHGPRQFHPAALADG